MTKPTIHLNGSSGESLLKGYRTAMEAVRDAQDKLAESNPNPRDYYTQNPEAWQIARAEHFVRANKLQEVYDELLELAMHCNAIITERLERQHGNSEDPSGENPGL